MTDHAKIVRIVTLVVIQYAKSMENGGKTMKRNDWKKTESKNPTRTGSDSGKVSTINSKRKKDGTENTDERADKIYVENVKPPYKGIYPMRLVWGERAFYMTKESAIKLAAKIVEAAI